MAQEEMHFETTEDEIKYLEEKILEKKKEIAERGPYSVASEVLKEHTAKTQTDASPPQIPVSNSAGDDDPATEKNVEILVSIAFKEGIGRALATALKTHNPHLIDAFHDALVDTFLERLRSAGKINS